MNDEMKDRKEILKELLLTEEDTLKKLKELIDKTKNLVKIDQKTNKIVVSSELKFSNLEKVLLFLIGRYFSRELNISDKEGMDIKELEQVSGIKKTTLSKPLGGLVYSGYIEQDDDKRYFVHHYKIEEVVNSLHQKFIEKDPKAKGIKIKYKATKKQKAKGDKNE